MTAYTQNMWASPNVLMIEQQKLKSGKTLVKTSN